MLKVPCTFVAILIAAVQLPAQEIGAVRFLAQFIPPIGNAYTAGCWGWTDSASGREYALLGNRNGTSIVEITDVDAIEERDFVPGPTSSWRELQVHGHYAYVVSEGGGGTQIIDLSTLPDSVRHVKDFVYSIPGGKNTTYAHSNHIRDGFLYLNGCADWSPGGVLIFSLADPENPAFTGEWAGHYAHDSYVRNDTLFVAGILGQGLVLVDIANKSLPVYMGAITYPGSGTHNAAVSEDGRYALTTDEIGMTSKTLKIWDLRQPPPHPKVWDYAGSPTAIVHNVFVKDDLAIMSYYTAGMRVLDISDPTHPIEVGGYDTYPANDNSGYTGAWSVYPFFPSGKIIIGDMVSGMYVVEVNRGAPKGPTGISAYSDYLTPTSVQLAWTDPTETLGGDPMSGFTIRISRNGLLIAEVDSGVGAYTDTGLVLHGEYEYSIATYNEGETSTPVVMSVFAGGAAAPKPVSGFFVNDMSDGIRLSWTNPAEQTDGTPLNDPLSVEIYRDGALHLTLPFAQGDTGSPVVHVDSVGGFHGYRVRVRDDETPAHYSEFSDSLVGYGSLVASYSENFELGPGSLTRNGPWDTTSAIAYSGSVCMTESPAGDYPNDARYTMNTPRVIVSPGMALTFRHIAIILGGDIGYVEISTNRGQNYTVLRGFNYFAHNEWRDSSADPGDWFPETFDLTPYIGDTIDVRFRFASGPSFTADGWYIDDISIDVVTGVEGPGGGTLPSGFRISQNHPNPFNPSTSVGFFIPGGGDVTITIHNVLGQEVRRLHGGRLGPGEQSVTWDGNDDAGSGVPSGAYFYTVTWSPDGAPPESRTRSMMLIR